MSQENIQINNEANSRYLRLIDDNMSVNPFGRSSVSDRAFKKTERLVLATYLVTKHVSDNDLCKEVRANAYSLLLLVAHSDNLFQNRETLSPVLLQIRIILATIDLLFVSDLVSEINTTVLKRGFMDFADFLLTSIGSDGAERASLHGIFDESAQTVKPITPKNQLKRGNGSGGKSLSETRVRCGKKSLNTQGDNKKERIKNVSVKSRAISTNRRVVILDMVAKSGKVTVKEVARQIPDTSPKTLQRELMNLVSEGVLKKEGNKRWTVYTLVRN